MLACGLGLGSRSRLVPHAPIHAGINTIKFTCRLYYDPVDGLAQNMSDVYMAFLWRRCSLISDPQSDPYFHASAALPLAVFFSFFSCSILRFA